MCEDAGPQPETGRSVDTGAHLDIAGLTDVGTGRDHNEDAFGSLLDGETCAVVAVADGVSSQAGGEVASQTAIEVLLGAYREEPAKLGPATRLYRAVQQANIGIYDKAVAVPELRGMATTLTAVVVDGAELTAVHVGDSRLYLLRAGELVQVTKDHTAAADKVRYGLMSKEKARTHPDRSVLTRSVGRELIVSRDRISQPLLQGDLLLLCSDGLYNVLSDEEIARLAAGGPAEEACRALVDAANGRGTPDNLTAAVVRVLGPTGERPEPAGLATRLRRLLGR
jgi:protein phosphatase